MLDLTKPRYSARLAASDADIAASQRLRHLAFFAGDGVDGDDYDARCRHVLVQENQSGKLVACFRLLPLKSGADIAQSYSAQFYDLSRLRSFPGPMLELGRFCIHPEYCDPMILRLAWGVMTRYVDRSRVEMLFGCSSFTGCDTGSYGDAFALLQDRHLAPERWRPQMKAPNVFCFEQGRDRKPDLALAMRAMPPLLRTYLAMGGWVSDHAVVDRDMDTLHVFTGVEINSIPTARKRQLRAIASEA